MVDEFPQAQALGEGGWQQQAGIGHQAVIVEGDLDAVEGDCVVASIGCSFSGTGFLLQNHYPRFRGAPLWPLQDADPTPSFGGFGLRIDRKPDVDKIDDEIIAEIRRSRFLVADFTHGDKGARGGVYYEAGFAYGLGKPVIYTCRADMVDYLHFDTRQYAHILWETPEELREGLKNKIVARIGEGTVLHTAT